MGNRNERFLGRSIEFSESEAKKQVKKLAKGKNKFAFKGIRELELAILNSYVQEGDLIFGSSTLAHALNKEGSQEGACYDTFPSLTSLIATGQWRKYPYLHVAVCGGFMGRCSHCEKFYRIPCYSPEYRYYHLELHEEINRCPECQNLFEFKRIYVIEIGGAAYQNIDIGMVSAIPLEEAFMKEAEFIAFTIPNNENMDSRGQNLTLQRALACLGLYYHYDMSAVSCEIFATAMMKLTPDFEPIQIEVLNSAKMFMGPPEVKKYNQFYTEIMKRLKKIEIPIVLTLEYYLDNIDQDALISNIKRDYIEKNYNAFDLNREYGPWFKDKLLEDHHDYMRTKDQTKILKGIVTCKGQFGYPWLNPNDKDAPEQLDLHLKAQKDNLDVETITQNAIKALRFGFYEIFQVLFDKGNEMKADWNTRDEFEYTALMYACAMNKGKIVSMLLQDHDIDVNYRTGHGKTALMLACQFPRDKEVISTLLERPEIDVNAQDEDGMTAFLLSGRYFLQDPRIDVNIKNDCGENFFTIACKNGFQGIVLYLLEENNHGIDLTSKDNDGNNCLMAAAANCGKSGDTIYMILEYLSKLNVHVNDQNIHGDTAVMIACKSGNAPIARQLVDNADGIDLNLKDNDGNTCFINACSIERNYRIIETLLKNSSQMDLNHQNDAGETAFIASCKCFTNGALPKPELRDDDFLEFISGTFDKCRFNVHVLLEKAKELNVDLTKRDNDDKAGIDYLLELKLKPRIYIRHLKFALQLYKDAGGKFPPKSEANEHNYNLIPA